MEVTPITQSEFDRKARSGKHAELAAAIFELEIGAGFRAPCVWEHNLHKQKYSLLDGTEKTYQTPYCPGRMRVHQLRNHREERFKTLCKEGELYVLRVA
jgi:hypothetical protein